MARDNFINGETAPQGKRTVRRNAYGNLVGYVGRTRWEDITCGGVEPFSEAEEKAAAAWIAGREDWQDAAWEN